jgi:hypothetical protein
MATEFDIRKTVDNVAELLHRVNSLAGSDVVVGVPSDKAARKQGEINNATLAYWHQWGTQHIPARPFLTQGIAKIRGEAQRMLREGAKNALHGKGNVDTVLNKIGILARNAVVSEITDPEPPFAPLKAATVRARLRRTKAGLRQLRTLQRRAKQAGQTTTEAILDWAGEGNAKPLIDTGQLRAAITYVVRKV